LWGHSGVRRVILTKIALLLIIQFFSSFQSHRPHEMASTSLIFIPSRADLRTCGEAQLFKNLGAWHSFATYRRWPRYQKWIAPSSLTRITFMKRPRKFRYEAIHCKHHIQNFIPYMYVTSAYVIIHLQVLNTSNINL
jgi:hypothetical protein